MSYYKQPISPMEGPERELMTFFLKQLKQWRGLKSTIEKIAGLNGKWMNPNEPYEIDATKMMRLLFIKALYQEEEDEYLKDAMDFREIAIEFCKAHNITLDKKKSNKTR